MGYPIGTSLSHVLHPDAFEHLNMDDHYHAFLVKEEVLGEAVRGLKALGISGFNVTTPNKGAMMDYLDEIDKLAKRIGAVNKVVHKGGKLIGYNTDG
ncbi:shikimate dehydrogenase, partial [Bacillus sp. S1-R4H1-FB]|uniref:shikimate dehydrogenase n=1 Tax=Bacillus sp. S1-R4H1-FB TaxID=1973492 RepID=UPI0034CDC605